MIRTFSVPFGPYKTCGRIAGARTGGKKPLVLLHGGPGSTAAYFEVLDALAEELNAPRFGRAGEILAEIGIETEWEFAQSRMMTDEEVAEIRAKLLGGEIPFSGLLQGRLCVVLGVEGYNAFVREYNGK